MAASPISHINLPPARSNDAILLLLLLLLTHVTLFSMNLRHRAAAAFSATSGSGMREDCWNECATAALVEAWGARFLHLNRGNLRQKDWKDVADSVNERQAAVGSSRKSSGQCKNRIDTLKKKYKIEKSKPGRSVWRFFSQLDFLVGVEKSSNGVKVKVRNPNSSLVLSSWGSSRVRTNFPDGAVNYRDGDFDGVEKIDEEGRIPTVAVGKSLKPCCGSRVSLDGNGDGGGAEFSELIRALERVGEVYERVERSKLEQTVELERQRMEFEKDLEIQRMKLFMETQLELQRMKWPKRDSDSGHSRSLSEAYKL